MTIRCRREIGFSLGKTATSRPLGLSIASIKPSSRGHRLATGQVRGVKKPADCGFFSRREWDSNPRTAQHRLQFSRLPQSTALPSLHPGPLRSRWLPARSRPVASESQSDVRASACARANRKRRLRSPAVERDEREDEHRREGDPQRDGAEARGNGGSGAQPEDEEPRECER